MTKQLTSAVVERIRPGKTRREIRDGGCRGLILVVQPSGTKTWAMRFRQRGSLVRMTLGPVDIAGTTAADAPIIGTPLTLASARRLAAQVNHQRASGGDVVAAKHRERMEREARTFAQAARDFIEQHAKRKTRRWQEQARLLGFQPTEGEGLELIRKGLADRWHDRPIAEIDGDDVHAIVDETREKGAPGLERRANGPTEARARAMFRTLSKMFAWLIAKRRLTQNPCAGVHRPETPPSRDRVLSNAEVVAFWRAADAERTFGALLKLLLLTGCRLNEVAGMRWNELSEDRWIIPGTRTKNHRAHTVPLPPMAREILGSVATDGDLVFTTTGITPVSGWSKIKARLDAAMQIPPWRLHDLRRTAVTGMAELGIRADVIELVVNHLSGARGGIAGVYNRSELMPERKAALERWAAHVEGLIEGRPANVIPLHVAGA